MGPAWDISSLTRGLTGSLITPPYRQPEDSWEAGVMNNSRADRRSPLGLFPGQPIPRLYDRVAQVLRVWSLGDRLQQAARFVLLDGSV